PPPNALPAVVPDAAHDLIAARVGRLPATCRRLLEAAAVAGNELHPDLLRDVLELTPAAVLSDVHDAVRAGVLIATDGPSPARFAHDLYRETIYVDLTPTSRLALHQQVGAGLEHLHAAGRTVFAGEVARHF